MKDIKNISLFEIIRALPIEPAMKEKLIREYPEYDADTQLELTDFCWNAFYDLKANIETLMREKIAMQITSGVLKPDRPIDELVAESTWNELEIRMSGQSDTEHELGGIRDQLKKLMQTT